jgi:hypothetical protein
MKKVLFLSAWISGAIGGLMMLLGVIAVLAGGILCNHNWSNLFYPGTGFVLLGIFLFIGLRVLNLKANEQE